MLDGVQDDIRTPDKLVDGVNDTMDGGHMWLAPILPGMVSFDVSVSLFSYSVYFSRNGAPILMCALQNFEQLKIVRKRGRSTSLWKSYCFSTESTRNV